MKRREWAVIALVVGFLISIVMVATLSEIREKKDIYITAEKNDLLQVTLSGAVKKPGTYFCKAGTTLKEVLSRAELTSFAHRELIQFKKVIYTSQNFEIPRKTGDNNGTEKNSFEQK